MLEQLNIKNVALISALELSFGEGFHVLTGETGAGKSILIDAINFVLGERASRDMIKTGADKASVEAVFEVEGVAGLSSRLAELGVEAEEGEPLLLSRELSAAGKSVCRINGVMVTRAILKSVSDLLIDVHGQHEHQSLLDSGKHIAFLDSFGAAEIHPIRDALAACYMRYSAASKRLNNEFMSEQERIRRIDVLKYQLDEIDAAKLRIDEEEELAARLKLLSNEQSIRAALEQSYAALSDAEQSALAQAGVAVRALSHIADMSPEYEAIHKQLEELYYSMEDLSFSLRDMKNGFYFDPELFEQVQERLDQMHTLKRKYGGTIAEILALRENMARELAGLEQSDALREELEHERDAALAAYDMHANELHAARVQIGALLSSRLSEQLHQLGMQKAEVAVSVVIPDAAKPSPNGLDQVEFLLSANAGEPLKPLAKVASGGELSRIMLAFKTVAADMDGIPTLIFDEIDSGISGHIASVVGKKMRGIARTHQVLCVTHLAQIAAIAQTHFFVEKHEKDGKTYTSVQPLDYDARCRELARIMGGRDTDVHAMEHARELLAAGQVAE